MIPSLVFIHGGYVLGVVRKEHPLETSRLSVRPVVPGSLKELDRSKLLLMIPMVDRHYYTLLGCDLADGLFKHMFLSPM